MSLFHFLLAGDGGELRLYPFPEAPVDVEPRNDRLVLFSSPRMLHRQGEEHTRTHTLQSCV
jgi:hypothetical protein